MRMNCGELVAGLEKKENLFSLSHMPWRIHGVFEDGKLKNEANRMDVAKKQILKNQKVNAASLLPCLRAVVARPGRHAAGASCR